ncbi:putative transporter [Actinoplanes missouriensis 431]|uniref:Putative transporter n=1 Tax=Actinoplanes missouriensis (strain ATCC 14538 / DSM 43046 / CBS 188.64 / JCM 3121 / NBRC 102363 / NCIMB 12654 / NRRL B-3342 / UNCC 431) TaxID=512565 RepID=I0H820_ACTM4|nr:putative transporter [Actinoplanes missouriensis]BAL89157.1 putative transporter [Actinoplanes missouriensis 431]
MRIPLNTFAIAFGLSGLAEAWTAAARVLSLPSWLPHLFWAVAAIAWVWLIAAHLIAGARGDQRLRDQLRHPAQGPLAALVPVTGMLLGAELAHFQHRAGEIVVLAAITVAALFAGWLIGTWLEGRLTLEAVHGGYLLPTVAGGLVAADAAAAVGHPMVGWAAFGVGVFFSIVITTLILLRLVVRPSLPDPLVPTVAILLAPPAVAGLAWFALAGDAFGPVPAAFAGLTVVLTLVELAFLPRFLRLPFSLGFWSFTFPAGAVTAFTAEASGNRAVTVVLLTALTAGLAALAVRSLPIAGRRRERRHALDTLTAADDADARKAARGLVGHSAG